MDEPDCADLARRCRRALEALGVPSETGEPPEPAADEAHRLLSLLDAHALSSRMAISSGITLDPPARAAVTTWAFDVAVPQQGADFRASVEKLMETISLLLPYRAERNGDDRFPVALALLGAAGMLLNALMVQSRPAQPIMVGTEPMVLPDAGEMLRFAKRSVREALEVLDELDG